MEMAFESFSGYGNQKLNDLCEAKWSSSSGFMFMARFIDLYFTKLLNRWLLIKAVL